MSRWRIVTVAALILLPVAVLCVLGTWFLWERGAAFLAWWPLVGCIALGYFLALYWHRRKKLLRYAEDEVPLHWTDRDREAWKLVEARAGRVAEVEPAKLTDADFYFQTAREMFEELARFYHPRARDPVGGLTVPEILAAVELSAGDLAELVDRYLPGGHLLTIDNWRRARQAADWYTTATKFYWMAAAVFSPLQTATRYAASQLGLSRPLQMLQDNLVAWFYTAYVHRVGTYLVDLNSGRLRVGARRYRELTEAERRRQAEAEAAGDRRAEPAPPAAAADPADAVRRVTLTVMGQVKAGKSSFVNAVLGERRAQTDVLPATAEVTRYELQPPGIPTRLVLLDTVGYGHEGPRQDQLKVTTESARQSDLLLLVMHARNPAREADRRMLHDLKAWFAGRPDLKMPRVLGVLTHIDLLSPSLEWSPPYDWQRPSRPKEGQIAQAVEAVREQLGDYLAGVVPLCTAEGKVYGVDEYFLPALAGLLDEVHAVALLRCLRAEVDTGKVRKVFHQLLEAGSHALRLLWQAPARP